MPYPSFNMGEIDRQNCDHTICHLTSQSFLKFILTFYESKTWKTKKINFILKNSERLTGGKTDEKYWLNFCPIEITLPMLFKGGIIWCQTKGEPLQLMASASYDAQPRESVLKAWHHMMPNQGGAFTLHGIIWCQTKAEPLHFMASYDAKPW